MFATRASTRFTLYLINLVHRLVVYSPQIIENYQLQSGEGLSVSFVLIWLVGDLCNLSGALLAGLLPTIIILGVYVSTRFTWYVRLHPLKRLVHCAVLLV